MSVKPILLHDYFAIKGGGERLALTLADGLSCPLHTAFWGESTYDKTDWPNVDINTFSKSSGIPALQMIRLISNWQRYKLAANYSTAIYSGSYAPLSVNGINAQRHVMYCHSPPRFLYDQREYFLKQLPAWQRPFLKMLMGYFQPRYEAAVSKMDLIIANSENVRQRIQKYLHRDAMVIHPPCDTEKFKWLGQGDYYLSTARLDPLKRVDLIVKAFCKMPDKRLVVTSGGPELPRLRRMAKGCPNITFTDWIDDTELYDLVGNAIATIYIPHDEDFGMSPVESMAAGKPVIGVAEGGLCESVVDGETGLLFDPLFVE
ncbi:MAG: glycosyltransferase, partial [Desulfobulbaceae bacterium]|nr:glycosyltransferase [Desulfobulbaceae bacterium]